jgi:hypothetical protein
MESQTLLALTSKRADITKCIHLLETRPSPHVGLAVTRLIDRLRLKADWLDKRIDLELRQSNELRASTVANISRTNDAA